jgi:hypothetical protein
MKFYLKNVSVDLSYCTNIHFGESWEEVFYILKFHSRKLRNAFLKMDQFGIGLRLSNSSIINLSKSSFFFDFLFWLKINNFYIKSVNGFPYSFFGSNYIKDNVYLPDWSNFKRYIYSRRIIILFSNFLNKNNFGGISTLPLSYKYFFCNYSYNNLYIKSIKYLYSLLILLNDIYVNNKIFIHLDIEPEPDCVVSNTLDYINFFKKWLLDRIILYFLKKKIHMFILNYFRICFDICHSSVEFESICQSFNSIFLFNIKFGKFQISSSLKIDKMNFYNSYVFSYLPETPYIHQVYGKTFYDNIITYKDISLAHILLYKKKIVEYRIHYHVPIFFDKYEIFESTQQYIIEFFKLLKKRNAFYIFEIETYTFDILPCYLKLNILYSLKREYDWVIKNLFIC